jgi:hypothetical protein
VERSKALLIIPFPWETINKFGQEKKIKAIDLRAAKLPASTEGSEAGGPRYCIEIFTFNGQSLKGLI